MRLKDRTLWAVAGLVVVAALACVAVLLGSAGESKPGAQAVDFNYVYSAKFVCGTAGPAEPQAVPGDYETAVNVHNPSNTSSVTVKKKAAEAFPEDEALGGVSTYIPVTLQPDRAFEIDCDEIGHWLYPEGTVPSFYKGFVVIESPKYVDVVGVYTTTSATASGVGQDIDVQRVEPQTVEAVETPTPTATNTPEVTPTPTETPEVTPTPTPTEQPEDPSFSITAGSADAKPAGGGYDPADILGLNATAGNAPVVLVTCAQLGLLGCWPEDPFDDLDALSHATDWPFSKWLDYRFSVDPTSVGAVGSAVNTEATTAPNWPEPEGDEFCAKPQLRTTVPAATTKTNTQVLDENGSSAWPVGLQQNSDIDALDDNVAELGRPVWFSLAPGSATLLQNGWSPADILLQTNPGGMPLPILRYATAATLNLVPTDNIDGLCIQEDGVAGYNPPTGNPATPGDRIFFSLAPLSPTLTTISAHPDDILKVDPAGGLPIIVYNESDYGLLTSDDINAMKCLEPSLTADPPYRPDSVCPDLDGNGWVNLMDVFELAPPAWNAMPKDPGWEPALDLDGNGWINLMDVFKLAPPAWNKFCTIPDTCQ